MSDVAYVPTSTEFAVRASLAAIYSGAGLQEAAAFVDRGSDCTECGNATHQSMTCDSCGSSEHTVALWMDRPS